MIGEERKLRNERYQTRKQRTRNWLACLFALVLLAGSGLACGQGKLVPYLNTFGSTGQCRAVEAVGKRAKEATLATTISAGPNSTICILRASDGILIRHYGLIIHGDVVGQAHGRLYLNERGGDDGHLIGLCARAP